MPASRRQSNDDNYTPQVAGEKQPALFTYPQPGVKLAKLCQRASERQRFNC